MKAMNENKRPKGEWIPFEWNNGISNYPNELDGKWVIVTDGKNISVERIKKDALDHFFPSGRWFKLEDTIAWMPLPERYRHIADKRGKE